MYLITLHQIVKSCWL